MRSVQPKVPPSNSQLGEFGADTTPYGDVPPDYKSAGPFFAPLQSTSDALEVAARVGVRALESGDPLSRREAAAGLEAALERRREVCLDLYDLVLGGLRLAARERPSELVEVLRTLLLADLHAELDALAADFARAVQLLADRISALEAAKLPLRQGVAR